MISITFEGTSLAAALKDLVRIVEKRTTIPILATVEIVPAKHGARLTTTNLDIEATTIVDPMDYEGGAGGCLPARMLYQIAKFAGPEPVMIKADDNDKTRATVTVGESASYVIDQYPVADFPRLDVLDWQFIETFTNDRLRSLLEKTAPSVSTEETRYYLNGVNWQTGADGRFFTATDGHRLTSIHYDRTPAEKTTSRIIHAATVKLLLALRQRPDMTVCVNNAETKIRIQTGDLTIIAKLIDGTFPDWRRVLPKDAGEVIEFRKDRLLQALARATVVSGERGRAVRLFNDRGAVKLSCRNADYGEATADAGAKWSATKTHEIGFNARYLRDALNQCATNDIRLRVTDAGSPARVENGDDDVTRVIMPMRI